MKSSLTLAQPKRRPIRSYVLRQGRMTPAQQQAFENYWPQYGLALTDSPLSLTEVFQRTAPCILEIGFGMGHSLITQAMEHSEYNYIGIEVHRPGVGSLLAQLHHHQLTNVRVYCHDAVEILQQSIADHSLSKVQIFFPDPWPKKRHHKRRLIQADFLRLLAKKLLSNGLLHIATDWEEYAENVYTLLANSPDFYNTAQEKFAPRPNTRPLTKFEMRGQRLGHPVYDLIFALKK